MKIGLIDVDSKIPNLALMKISAYHKLHHDSVEWYSYFSNLQQSYDQIYASKIFTRSLLYAPKNTILGGSGVNLTRNLPDYIEHIYPDYSLYGIDYAMGYLTRGCINQCSFCIVPKKEGILRRHAYLSEFLNGQTHLLLLDNALTDFTDAWKDLIFIRDNGIHLNLCQGFNIRTIKLDCAKILSEIKLWKGKQWRIAWDTITDEQKVLKGIQILNNAGIKSYRLMCYVLVGYNTSLQEDLYRVHILDKLDVDPFVMIYKKSKELHHLARWCNRPQLRHSCTFQEYLDKKLQKN